MAATCDCGWTGGPMQVRDGGRCPECWSKVSYDKAPVPQLGGIKSVEEFNRRAITALRGVTMLPGTWDKRFAQDMTVKVDHGNGWLSEKQQQALYNVVHRYRRQITDVDVTEYALMHARGAD